MCGGRRKPGKREHSRDTGQGFRAAGRAGRTAAHTASGSKGRALHCAWSTWRVCWGLKRSRALALTERPGQSPAPASWTAHESRTCRNHGRRVLVLQGLPYRIPQAGGAYCSRPWRLAVQGQGAGGAGFSCSLSPGLQGAVLSLYPRCLSSLTHIPGVSSSSYKDTSLIG